MARGRAQEEATRTALRIFELEAAFSHKATLHTQARALILVRDTLRSQIAKVREGMCQGGALWLLWSRCRGL